MKQWYFKITDYAEELAKDLNNLSWPDSVIEMQRGWIGRSKGVTIDFYIKGTSKKLTAFTTRVETVMGVTFIAISPEHSLLKTIELSEEERNFIENVQNKSETTRKIGSDVLEIQNLKAIHPLTKLELPVIVAEYVLMVSFN